LESPAMRFCWEGLNGFRNSKGLPNEKPQGNH
jgi:hypothetical protein